MKNSFDKNNKQDIRKFFHNYKEGNIRKLNNNSIAKKLGLISIPIKQSKLSILEKNKSNNSLLKTNGQSRSNENRDNKFLFPEKKDTQVEKIFINSKPNKEVNSKEKRHKRISYSQKNTKENIINKAINSGKPNINKKEENSRNNFKNKNLKDIFPTINNKDSISNKFSANLNKTNYKDIFSKDSKDNNKEKNDHKLNDSIIINKDIKKEILLKMLSRKEKAFYILSESKILNLYERIIFSRTTQKIRQLISIKEILKDKEIIIKNQIKELEQKLINYNKNNEENFSPTKTAIISLNLIMKDDEDEFKNLDSEEFFIDDNEKHYYDIYIQILFVLLGAEIKENLFGEFDKDGLYDKLRQKGFQTFKDYLYQLFVLQKFKELFNENSIIKYNRLFEKLPNLIKYEGKIKNNKFISFSYFILYEANFFLKKYKELIRNKIETQNSIDILKKKISFINK